MQLDDEQEKESTCPHCGKHNDRASGVNEAGSPGDGDLSFCIGCGTFSIFEADAPGGVRPMTDDEAAELATNTDAQAVMRSWRDIEERRNHPPKLSTGQPSTLGVWRDNCAAFLGEDSAPTRYFDSKIAASPMGRDEPVLADESQVMAIIGALLHKET